jgi:flagellar biosynthesis/type III secretory pathway protein FliH
MAEAEVRRNLQNGFENILRHTLFYGEVRILRARGIEEIKSIREEVKKAFEIIEDEKIKLKEDARRIFNDAKESGRQEGINEFKDIIRNFIEEKERLLKEIEQALMERVMLISEKVLEQELLINPACIISIIRNEVKKLGTDSITIVLNNSHLEELRMTSPEFSEEVSKMNVHISGDEKLKRGECLLKCNSGEVNLSVKRRLKKLSDALNNEY